MYVLFYVFFREQAPISTTSHSLITHSPSFIALILSLPFCFFAIFKGHQYYQGTDNQGSKSHKKMPIFSRFFGRDIKISSKRSKHLISARYLRKMTWLLKWIMNLKEDSRYMVCIRSRTLEKCARKAGKKKLPVANFFLGLIFCADTSKNRPLLRKTNKNSVMC